MTSTMRFDKWQDSLGVTQNSVVQVVSDTLSLYESTSVDGIVTSGYYISITPKFANSKILVMMNFLLYRTGSGGGVRAGIGRSINGGAVSDIFYGGVSGAHNITHYSANWNENHHRTALTTLDSPATTQQVRYYVRYGAYGAGTTHLGNGGHQACNFTLMEIAQ